MKKTLILMAAASAFVLTSCTENDLSGDTSLAKESAPSAIEFSAKTGNTGMTRAGYEGDLTNTSIKNATAGFGVFAYYSGKDPLTTWGAWDGTAATPVAINKAPNFMYNEKLTWTGGSGNPANVWNYSPVKYWPNGKDTANPDDTPSNTATEADAQYLSFFAYAPYVEAKSTEYAYNTTDSKIGADTDDAPTGGAVLTVDDATALQNGIVAMSKNSATNDMHVKYILNPASASDGKSFVDLTWGLRGKLTYNETDNQVNHVPTLGNVYNTDLTKQPVDEKVTFLFKHALSRVAGSTKSTTSGSGKQVCGLWVVVDVDKNSDDPGVGQSAQETYFSTNFSESKTLVTIESVKIRDKYSYDQEQTTKQNWTSDFFTDGWFDIMNGTWKNTTMKLDHTKDSKGVTYSVTANNAPGSGEYALNTEIKENETGLSNPTGADWSTTNSGGATGVTLEKKKVYDDVDVPGLLLIPGSNPAGNTLYVTVKYHVRTADNKLSTGFSHVTQEITNKVSLGSVDLKPNKYYNLVMHLGLTSVKFEAVVADWSNGNDKYEEDGGETNPAAGENNTSVWLPSNVIYSTQATVEAGATKTLNIGANNTSYTINLTGLTPGNTVEVTKNGNAASATVTPSYTSGTNVQTDGFATVTITGMTANNTGSPANSVITITEKDSESHTVTTTEVTLTQASAVTP